MDVVELPDWLDLPQKVEVTNRVNDDTRSRGGTLFGMDIVQAIEAIGDGQAYFDTQCGDLPLTTWPCSMQPISQTREHDLLNPYRHRPRRPNGGRLHRVGHVLYSPDLVEPRRLILTRAECQPADVGGRAGNTKDWAEMDSAKVTCSAVWASPVRFVRVVRERVVADRVCTRLPSGPPRAPVFAEQMRGIRVLKVGWVLDRHMTLCSEGGRTKSSSSRPDDGWIL